jgi:hypothetical protein
MANLFELVVNSQSREMGWAIWFSTDSDHTQRNMLRASVSRAAQFSGPQKEGILWALNKIDDSLRHHRNDAIHAPLIFVHGDPRGDLNDSMHISVISDLTSANPRAKSLWKNSGPDLRKWLRDQTRLAESLDGYLHKICNSIIAPTLHSWPDKPKLPHAHQKKSRKGLSGRSNAKRPQRPRESSGA